MSRTRRFAGGLTVFFLAAAMFALGSTPAVAAAGGTGHTISMTEHQHGTFTDDGATNPCTGAPGVATFVGNSVDHVTFFPAGDEVWATFTETGKVTVTWDGVTYTGHATAWGNFNMNEKNSNSTFTLNLRVFAADGSSVVGHEVTHFGLNANGVVTASFDKLSFSCT
jgi:ABC-type oligopeptide transport system substrate-binding subunit